MSKYSEETRAIARYLADLPQLTDEEGVVYTAATEVAKRVSLKIGASNVSANTCSTIMKVLVDAGYMARKKHGAAYLYRKMQSFSADKVLELYSTYGSSKGQRLRKSTAKTARDTNGVLEMLLKKADAEVKFHSMKLKEHEIMLVEASRHYTAIHDAITGGK